jgi:hypothetical protein
VTWTRDVLNLPAQLVSGMILTMLKVHIISESSAKKIYERTFHHSKKLTRFKESDLRMNASDPESF